MVNPNVGAVLVLDPRAAKGWSRTRCSAPYLEHRYPAQDVPHAFMRLEGSFRSDLEEPKSVVRAAGWKG